MTTAQRIHILSAHQPEPSYARLLIPDSLRSGDKTIVYLLPVEPSRLLRLFGDATREAQKLDLANRHGVVFAEPGFAQSPWYGDHPSDPLTRQETHFVEAVCPQVEASIGWSDAGVRRLLLGFSKSGRGAWSLLLRHPDRFEAAYAWDAPLMMESVDLYEAPSVFGTQEHFLGYCLPRLLERCGEAFRRRRRLAHSGFHLFGEDGSRMHGVLDSLGIPHAFEPGQRRKHHWAGGWLADGAATLLSLGSANTRPA